MQSNNKILFTSNTIGFLRTLLIVLKHSGPYNTPSIMPNNSMPISQPNSRQTSKPMQIT